jgi:hypothetical protein
MFQNTECNHRRKQWLEIYKYIRKINQKKIQGCSSSKSFVKKTSRNCTIFA